MVGVFEDTIAMVVAKNLQIMTYRKAMLLVKPPMLLIFLLNKSINDLGHC